MSSLSWCEAGEASGYFCRRWKNLERWYEAMEARPAYIGTRSDFYTHVHDLPPQLGGDAIAPTCMSVTSLMSDAFFFYLSFSWGAGSPSFGAWESHSGY